MIAKPEERELYSEIQRKLFYIIPEKWEKVYLYTSVIDIRNKRPKGEMFFYYIPKGILKKREVNGYEIPSLFNIDEESYAELISKLYETILRLREVYMNNRLKVWSNITISIENCNFKIEYGYEKIDKVFETPYERHIIWRHRYLHPELDLYNKQDRMIIEKYEEEVRQNGLPPRDVYEEGIYQKEVRNIIDYEKTLSVDAAIAQSKEPEVKPKKKKKKGNNEEEIVIKNQILFGNNKNE